MFGPWMRYLILGSIVVSQLGFVSAYTIFVAENLQVEPLVLWVQFADTCLSKAFVMGVPIAQN